MPDRKKEVKIVEGAIEGIRKHPHMYAGKKPWGSGLASHLIQDIVYLNALPAQVDRIEAWWIVSSAKDWLVSPDEVVSLAPFSKIVPFPVAGDNCHRAEVVIAALSAAVVTCGRDGLTWICGDPDHRSLPAELTKKASSVGTGRIVAFTIDDEG